MLTAYALCEFIFDRVELVSGRLLTCATTCLAHCWNLPVLSRFHFPSTSSISQQQQHRKEEAPHFVGVVFAFSSNRRGNGSIPQIPLFPPLHQQMHSSGLAVCCSRIKRMPLAAQSKSRRFDLALKQLKLCYVCWLTFFGLLSAECVLRKRFTAFFSDYIDKMCRNLSVFCLYF